MMLLYKTCALSVILMPLIVTAQSRRECKDDSGERTCNHWKNYCTNEHQAVLDACRKTCGVCRESDQPVGERPDYRDRWRDSRSGDCSDAYTSCPNWKGYCDQLHKNVLRYCRTTCGTCGVDIYTVVKDICQVPPQECPFNTAERDGPEGYYYDARSGGCTSLPPGFCPAQGNHFPTLEHCQQRCHRDQYVRPDIPNNNRRDDRRRRPNPNNDQGERRRSNSRGNPRDRSRDNRRRQEQPSEPRPQRYPQRGVNEIQDRSRASRRRQEQPLQPQRGVNEITARNRDSRRRVEAPRRRPATAQADQCSQPRAPGTCRDRELAFYYDSNTQSCQEFTYSGCGGNENRFLTYGECEARCVLSARESVVRGLRYRQP